MSSPLSTRQRGNRSRTSGRRCPRPWRCVASLILLLTLALLAFADRAIADEVRLDGGDVINGKVVEITDDLIIFQSPILGRLEIPREKIKSLIIGARHPKSDAIPTATRPSTQPASAPATQTAGFPPASQPSPLDAVNPSAHPSGWHHQIDIGVSGEQATTNSNNIHLGYLAKRTDEEDRTKVDAQYNFGDTDNNTSTNNGTAGINNDWLVPHEDYFYFATGRYEYNQFGDWAHRVSFSAGPGYNFIQNAHMELIGRFGLGAYKQFKTANQAITPEGSIGFEFNWYVARGQKISASNTYYPELIHLGEFRDVAAFDWTMKLAGTEHVALKLGLQNEYQSNVQGTGNKANDFRFLGALLYAF